MKPSMSLRNAYGLSNFILVILFLAFASFSSFAGTAPSGPDGTISAGRVLLLINSYPSTQDFLEQVAKAGLMPNDQKTAIADFLKSKNIDLEKKLPTGTLKNDTATFGSTKVVFLKDGSLKTQKGQIIKFTENEPLDQVFIDTYVKISGAKPSRSPFAKAVLPPAEASVLASEGMVQRLQYAGVAAWALTNAAIKKAYPLWKAGCNGLFDLDYQIVKLNRYLHNLTVSCNEEDGYQLTVWSKDSTATNEQRLAKDLYENVATNVDNDPSPFTVSQNATLISKCLPFILHGQGLSSGDTSVTVDDSVVTKAISGNSQPCNADRAKAVQIYIRENLRKVQINFDAQVATALNPPNGAKPTSGGATDKAAP